MAEKKKKAVGRPADTPESREKQLTNMAMDLAHKQLLDGTAPPSVVQHFLKVGSSREQQEREMLTKQADLLEAKVSNMSVDRDAQEAAEKAIEAIRSYNKGG